MIKPSIFTIQGQGEQSSVSLLSPTLLPNAGHFLWNAHMMIQMNCRGYAVSQFMQPEPAKYSFAPNIEAKTFMQPEHPYYAHHPGRFFYIKDEQTGEVFSAPYEPMRKPLDSFEFIAGDHDITWCIEALKLNVTIRLTLAHDRPIEIWSVNIKNIANQKRKISVYSYFSIGYMSWMNQSASFNKELNAIVADSITPYQKVEQYFENKALKQQTFLMSDKPVSAWCANQARFEGEGGLHSPDGIRDVLLLNEVSRYETPVAVMQHQWNIHPMQDEQANFLFGPAKDSKEISAIKLQYFASPAALQCVQEQYKQTIAKAQGAIKIASNDAAFDDMVNHWLPRQIYYHGDVNRLTTDPQTRNYIQDNMGMCYFNPATTRQSFLLALSQQMHCGAMPDGILLHPNAELKYINQIPHTDHCVWLAICLVAYLDETADHTLLDELVPFSDHNELISVVKHIELSFEWLVHRTDERGLSYIEQGDWCDPMNMVGYKGKGVSAWLSMATVYAIDCWLNIVQQYLPNYDVNKFAELQQAADLMRTAINQCFWDGQWYARGITDDGRLFGCSDESEGKIFLNSQSWALLSKCASPSKTYSLLNSVHQQLSTPYGMAMLAPSYTGMVEDIGRVTQKYPGTAENGSVYNHAAVFYVYSLYQINEANQAFDVLKQMIPTEADIIERGQLPTFIPNYYRGAYHQFPEHAGRSSQLFNTGTVAWLYRCIIEELCGLKGQRDGLVISPKLPDSLVSLCGTRRFRGADFIFTILRADVNTVVVSVNDQLIEGNVVKDIEQGKSYQLCVQVPK